MKIFAVTAFFLWSLEASVAFVPLQSGPLFSRLARFGAEGEGEIPKRSRLEGNQVAPSQADLIVMDKMINKLANAKPYELPNAVRRAFRVISSPKFFIRIATLADESKDPEEKEKLAALASNLVAVLGVVVETTQETLDERAKEVEAWDWRIPSSPPSFSDG
jgi:hypothetical protein